MKYANVVLWLSLNTLTFWTIYICVLLDVNIFSILALIVVSLSCFWRLVIELEVSNGTLIIVY